MMESPPTSSLQNLSFGHKATLKRANILTVEDLVLQSVSDIAKKCRISHVEAQELMDIVCDELAPPLHSVFDPEVPKDATFTTGDALIDRVLGGGLRTGKLWEVVGESAAGKTQFAMQLSLCVQLPPHLGGLDGAACFLSTSWTLPTHRLLEIVDAHPLLSPEHCTLDNIHTLKTPTLASLQHVLAHTLPAFIAAQAHTRPVRLIVLDALAELFRADPAASNAGLWARARTLGTLSTHLHALAHKHNLAVVAINEVIDVPARPPQPDARAHEVAYREQARWFARADGGEGGKEAALGLVWANQVNARVMLARTRRMRYVGEEWPRAKRVRREEGADAPKVVVAGEDADQPVRVRRLTVVFNSVGPPGAVDYVVTAGGVMGLPDEDGEGWELEDSSPPRKLPASATASASDGPVDDLGLVAASSEVGLDDLGLPSETNVTSEGADAAENGPQVDSDDEWDAYWKGDDMGSDVYSQVNLEALSSSLPE